MKKTEIIVCNEFKYRDLMFKNYMGNSLRANKAYRAMIDDDGSMYVCQTIDGYETMIFIPYLDKQIRDPRFTASYSLLTIDWIVSNGLPEIDNVDELTSWMDKDLNEENNEEFEDDFYDVEGDIVAESYCKIKSISNSLSTGVLEALSGVISLDMGDLIDDDRKMLIDALKTSIHNYSISNNYSDLYVAQYLLFNIINLAKNKW